MFENDRYSIWLNMKMCRFIFVMANFTAKQCACIRQCHCQLLLLFVRKMILFCSNIPVSSFEGGANVHDTSTNEKFVASLKWNSRRIDKSLGRSAVQRDLRRKLPAIKKIVEEGESKWEQMMRKQISNCSKTKRQPRCQRIAPESLYRKKEPGTMHVTHRLGTKRQQNCTFVFS